QPVVDDRRNQAPLRGCGRLLLDHRRNGEDVVRREVLRARVPQVDGPPLTPEERDLVVDEPGRGREPRELVGRREEEAFDRAAAPVLSKLTRRLRVRARL